ncbi:MAG: hypothetical protein K0U12_02975 [Gammaproteobacteria bacterium]|nr:hypothetical protein [Gammaproteobacteria bacterium]
MKKTLLTICAIAALTVTASFASSNLLNASRAAMSEGPVIYTLHTITPGHKRISLDELRVYLGSSSVCDNAHLFMAFDISGNTGNQLYADPGVQGIGADDISIYGPGYTCIKYELFYHGKAYTLGPVKLISKNGEYIAASPNSGTLNFMR